MRRALPAVLAVVLPAIVLGGALWSVYAFEGGARTDAARTELAKAGEVINGKWVGGSAAAFIDADLAASQPRVVVLGNSYAATNFDAAQAARALRLPPRQVRVYAIPHSVGSHWYAILKNRIVAGGHRPRAVVIVSGIQSMLLVEPYSEAGFLNLWAQVGPDEPALEGRAGSRTSLAQRKLAARRDLVRDAVLTSVRNGSVSLLFPSPQLAQETDDAMARVFDDRNVDMTHHGNAMPVAQPPRGGVGPLDIPHPDASLVPEMVAMAHDAGIELVFARSPMAPATPPQEQDRVPDGWIAATQAAIAGRGTWIDLSAMPLPDAAFLNPGHMTDEGARAFTRLLVREALDPRPDGVDLLGGLHPVDGAIAVAAPPGVFAADPPAVPRARRPIDVSDADPGFGRMRVDDLGVPTDADTLHASELAIRCSPLQVLEDGVPLPRPHETCADADRDPGGRQCVGPDGVVRFSSVRRDSIDGHAYTLRLDPDRACLDDRWLYPGDRLTLPVPAGATGALTVTAAVPGGGRGEVAVQLRDREGVLAEGALSLSGRSARAVEIAVPPPTGAPRVLVLDNPTRGFVLLTGASIDAGP